MGLKNIDFKQLLLQKGERFALVVCVGIMGLLLVIYGLSSVLSAGPQKNVDEITKLRASADSSWKSSQPTEGLESLPDDLKGVEYKKVDADLYACTQLYFQLLEREDKKWRIPLVLAPDEFQVGLLRTALQSYILQKDPNGKIVAMVLKEKAAADKMSEQAQKNRREAFKKVDGLLGSIQKKLKSNPRTIVPPLPPGGGEGGMGAAGPGGREGGIGLGLPGGPGDRGQSAAIKEMDLKPVPVDKLEGEILAEAYTPIRMVEVIGMFPYKAQLEEFRKALRMNTVEELFHEQASTPEFTGFNIQRRVYTLDGKPVREEWEDLDFETPFKIIRAKAKELEPE
ncbi:MAG TPA: hypothetical protein VGY77_02555, partial [Gemmataceae bacterium]|nr:hypothetical protein [Gemmataceae bacterium]